MLSIAFKSVLIFNLIHLNCGKVPSDQFWNSQYFYQVYVKSFKDTDGDGIGDLNGVIYGLNHIRSLGVNSVILSPSFERVDECEVNGIKNFYHVNAQYGTEENMNNLINRANKAGMEVILDLNLDQMSTVSEWFLLSSKKEINYEEFYIWKGMDIPYQINSSYVDTGFAWKWDENRKEYYLVEGNATIGYPVLNYKSRKVIEEIKNLLIFWMERDISGFRLFSKAEIFTDRTIAESFSTLKNIVDNYSKQHGGKPRILIGEFKCGIQILYKSEYERIRRSFHLVFVENLITQDEKSSARDIKFCVDEMMTYSPEAQTANWMIGNSKSHRVSERVGRRNSANFAILAFALPGNVIINQGDEIGMSDAEVYDKICQTTDVLEACSPFQWEDSPNAGFSTNPSPWYPVAKNYHNLNLKRQKSSANSSFKMYKDLAGLREAPMIKSDELNIRVLSDGLLYFTRHSPSFDEVIIVLLNFGSFTETANLSALNDIPDELTVILTSEDSVFKMGDIVSSNKIKLYPGEGLVFMVSKKKCDDTKPVSKIVNKLTDAAQRIGAFLNW